MTFKPYKPLHQPTRTQQAAANDADINVIAARFLKTGVLPVTGGVPQYGDATLLPILEGVLTQHVQARALYDSLPEQVRAETGGDPSKLQAWIQDPRNLETAIRLKLVTTRPVAAPPPAPGDSPPPPGAAPIPAPKP